MTPMTAPMTKQSWNVKNKKCHFKSLDAKDLCLNLQPCFSEWYPHTGQGKGLLMADMKINMCHTIFGQCLVWKNLIYQEVKEPTCS